ncbi:hypothetical protein TN53_37455 [Streptomyces sp. WM6386]|nr:hypothetical protein TN53_37455 [Streptomyces sp. WM6386]
MAPELFQDGQRPLGAHQCGRARHRGRLRRGQPFRPGQQLQDQWAGLGEDLCLRLGLRRYQQGRPLLDLRPHLWEQGRRVLQAGQGQQIGAGVAEGLCCSATWGR